VYNRVMIGRFSALVGIVTLSAIALSQVVAPKPAAKSTGPIRALVTPHSNALSWLAGVGGDPAQGFHVWKSSTSGAYGSTPLAATSATTLTYTDLAVVAGQTNYYVITAYNMTGDSAPSNQVTCVTPFQIPPPPTGLSGAVN
jgi:hypothetical protein